jgi:hypothetical protein
MTKLLLVRRYLHNVRSQSTSCKRGRCMSRCCEIRLQTACVMYTCFTTPNQCPCLMRPLPCMAICRNTTTRRAASNHVSLSPLPRQCLARWAVHGRQAAEVRRAPRRQSRRMAMSPSFINSSGSPTTLPSLLLRVANVPCPCQRYFMGGEGAWDHINSCLHHASNWTCAHDHVLRALERICNDAGFATTHKRVLTSEGNRHADLEIRNIRVAGQTDLLVDVTVRQNFKGAGHDGQTQGQLRNPDNRTTSSRAPPTRSAIIATHIAATGMWLFCRRACLPRAASTASSCT